MAKKAKRAARKSKVALPNPVAATLGYDPNGPMEQRRIEKVKEGETEVTLDDGTVLSVRQALVDVKRAVGQWNPHGDPIYVVQAAGIISTKHVPKKLRRK